MPDRTVVLLHGYAGRPSAWRRVIDAWPAPAPRFETITLPGHGPDALPLGPDFRSAVAEVAKRLPAAPVHLVGYSLGGRIALGLAAEHGDRVDRLSLIGVNPGIDDDVRAARRASDEVWARRLESEGLDAFIGAWSGLALFATQARLCEARRQEQTAWRQALDAPALAAAMRQLSLSTMPDYRSALARLEPTVQLIVGALDAKFRDLAVAMAAQVPGAQLHVVPETGHNVPLEAPVALAKILSTCARRGRPDYPPPR